MDDESEERVIVTEDDFKIDDLKEKVISEKDGAVSVFNGLVRNKNKGQKIKKLELQRYEGMTEDELEKVRDEAVNNFKVNDVLLLHRYGELDIGDNIVGIVVTASHREPAFEACRYCIDRIKEKVPLWKKETPEGGEARWLGEEKEEG
ncbi:MAG: molybdenum cofactor biosynthesis protein MoaE [Candidatus Thermoplasmatota archaeon]|nr:molybdenum cofactor biosynthesis protein MoaE [Candidatus Thermoplasmatota archaeon]